MFMDSLRQGATLEIGPPASHPLFDRHRATLEAAVAALSTRGYWSPYPDDPDGRRGGQSAADGRAAFERLLGRPFDLNQPGTTGQVGQEMSPYGIPLGIDYPRPDLDTMLRTAVAAMPAWRRAGVAARTGICLEILDRLHRRSFELAFATMHTTGQGFAAAFQAGGPHAQDRGLEAAALAYAEMSRTPERARWEKPQGEGEPLRVDHAYRVVPRGVGLVIGCATAPNWNAYPAIFADLATGNAVLVKPHPQAILPLALTVRVAREVLDEQGFDPNLIMLAADAADAADAPVARQLATRPEIALVDYAGGSEFGVWLEANARHAAVFTQKSGVNWVVIESTTDFRAMIENLAVSLSLCAGQMATTPRNIFVPKHGIETENGPVRFDDVARGIAGAIDRLLADKGRAVEVLGAIQSKATLDRLDRAAREGFVVLPSRTIEHPRFVGATVQTPLLVKVDPKREAVYAKEMFGPIAYLIPTQDSDEALERAARVTRLKGAVTASVYSARREFLERAMDLAMECGVPLSCNLVGGLVVSHSAAFSDFHATGANPAANSALVDAAFVAPRFRVFQSRTPA